MANKVADIYVGEYAIYDIPLDLVTKCELATPSMPFSVSALDARTKSYRLLEDWAKEQERRMAHG